MLFLWSGLVTVANSAQTSTILILGDSLSSAYNLDIEKAWVRLLEARLQTEGYGASLVNASITGETTRGGIRRLPRLLTKYHPNVVIIELGSNDGLRGFPLKVMEKNLTKMVALSHKAGAKVIVAGNRLPPNYSEAYSNAFHRVFAKVSEQTGSAYIGFFLKDIATDSRMVLDDQIHPNHLAQPILRDRVYHKLIPLLQDN